MMSCLYDVLNSIIYDVDFVNHNNERACAKRHLQCLNSNAVVIFDRGYFSYYLLYQVMQNNLHAVFRVQEGNRNKTIKDFSDSNSDDLIVSYTPSAAVKSDLRKRKLLAEFPCLTLRLIKHTDLNGEYILATTLAEQEYYEAGDFHDLYHHRWNIEELYKFSRSNLCVEDFHSQNEKGVKQEIQAHILLLNLTRVSGNDIHHRGKDNDCIDSRENKQKLNFKNCLFLVVKHMSLLIKGIKNI